MQIWNNKHELEVIHSRRDEGTKKMLEWNGEDIMPRELAIETVFGCNLSCEMCFIDQPTHRKKGVMPMMAFLSPLIARAEQVLNLAVLNLCYLIAG